MFTKHSIHYIYSRLQIIHTAALIHMNVDFISTVYLLYQFHSYKQLTVLIFLQPHEVHLEMCHSYKDPFARRHFREINHNLCRNVLAGSSEHIRPGFVQLKQVLLVDSSSTYPWLHQLRQSRHVVASRRPQAQVVLVGLLSSSPSSISSYLSCFHAGSNESLSARKCTCFRLSVMKEWRR